MGRKPFATPLALLGTRHRQFSLQLIVWQVGVKSLWRQRVSINFDCNAVKDFNLNPAPGVALQAGGVNYVFWFVERVIMR